MIYRDMGNIGQFEQITNEKEHDAVVNKATQSANIPIVMIVTSSTPNSKMLLEQLLQLAKHEQFNDKGLKWYELPLSVTLSPFIKFGPQNCPIVILMRGSYCETLLGVRDGSEVEQKVIAMLER